MNNLSGIQYSKKFIIRPLLVDEYETNFGLKFNISGRQIGIFS